MPEPQTAAQIIAAVRGRWANPDALDFRVAADGIAPYGDFYQEVYALANEGHDVGPGTTPAELEERKQRAAQLWEQVLPGLEQYADECRRAKYTGWSWASNRPLRRTTDHQEGTPECP